MTTLRLIDEYVDTHKIEEINDLFRYLLDEASRNVKDVIVKIYVYFIFLSLSFYLFIHHGSFDKAVMNTEEFLYGAILNIIVMLIFFSFNVVRYNRMKNIFTLLESFYVDYERASILDNKDRVKIVLSGMLQALSKRLKTNITILQFDLIKRDYHNFQIQA